MRIEQLEYVLAVARYGSLSKASENIFIGQPTLSTAIASLEKELGHPLFKRTRRGMELTQLGEDLLPLMERTVEDFFAIKKKAGVQAAGKVHMQLAAAGPAMPVLATAVARNRGIFPNVLAILHQQSPANILYDLARKRFFLALSFCFEEELAAHRRLAEERRLRLVPTMTDRLVLFSKSCGQFSDCRCMDMAELQEPNCPLALPFDLLHTGLSSTPSPWCALTSVTVYQCREQLKRYVAEMDGLAITSQLSAALDPDFQDGHFRCFELTGSNNHLVHYMSYAQDRLMNEAEADLIQQVESYYSYLML